MELSKIKSVLKELFASTGDSEKRLVIYKALKAMQKQYEYREVLMQFKYDYEQGENMADNYMEVCKLLREGK